MSLLSNSVKVLAKKHELSEEAVRPLLADFIAILHEAAFKGSWSDTLPGVYFALGDEAAWHWLGAVLSTLGKRDRDTVADLKSIFIETAQRLDPEMARHSVLLKNWQQSPN